MSSVLSSARLLLGLLLAAALFGVAGHDLLTDTPTTTTARAETRDVDRRAPAVASAPEEPPSRLVVPTVDLDVPVVPIEMDASGVLTPPADVDTVGWWQRSATPGAGDGQTLITGHSVREGDGAMDRLGELRAGDRVRVRTGDGTTDYRALTTEVLSRAEIAEQAQSLFGQQRRDGRLVLVTCTDWDGDVYLSNIVVVAERVRSA